MQVTCGTIKSRALTPSIGGRRPDGAYTGKIMLDGVSIEHGDTVYGIRYVRQFPVIGHPNQTAIASLLMYGHRYGIGGIIKAANKCDKRDTMYKRASLLICMFRRLLSLAHPSCHHPMALL